MSLNLKGLSKKDGTLSAFGYKGYNLPMTIEVGKQLLYRVIAKCEKTAPYSVRRVLNGVFGLGV